jgi:DNA replication licensing factor MCM2
MRISEAFCRMRLSDYVSSQDVDRAIAVTIDSFVGSQKVSCKKALARAFAKYTLARPGGGKKAGGGRNLERGQRAPTATMA